MKLLIRLQTPTELATYEGAALALTLASFEHEVQLYLDSSVFGLLMQPNSRLHGMVKSLDLYDIPPAWLPDDVLTGWLMGMVDVTMEKQLSFVPEVLNMSDFDQVLSF